MDENYSGEEPTGGRDQTAACSKSCAVPSAGLLEGASFTSAAPYTGRASFRNSHAAGNLVTIMAVETFPAFRVGA